jgi:hypothetical protein
MNRKAVRSLAFSLSGALVLLGTSTIGCGGGNSGGDGGDGKGYGEASVSFDTQPDTTSGDTSADTVDAGGTPPPIGAGSKLILAGNIQLIGSGPDTCTNQVPPTGDRWCGFARLSTDLMNYELWVVDVTKASAPGSNVVCDPSVNDPACVRLSTGLFVDSTNGLRVNAFDGDTLVYEEVPSMAMNGFLGSVFAWRPGWMAPHNISGSSGFFCTGHATTTSAVCFANPQADPTNMFFRTVELHAGTLTDADGELPLIGTLLVHAANDATGVTKFSFQLSPDGQAIGWSTRATDTGTEDLQWQLLNDDTSRIAVATDVDGWIITNDSKEWLWLKSFNYDQNGAPSGTLQSAAYPGGGASPTTVAQKVGDFMEAGSDGVIYRTSVSGDVGTLLIAPNRDMPSSVAMVDSAVAFVFGTSADGKTATYTKNIASTASGGQLFDVYAGNSVGAMPCTLTSNTDAFMPPTFLGNGSLMAWGKVNTLTSALEGWQTSLPSCASTLFANDIILLTAIGTQGAVYLDTVNSDPNTSEGTLRDSTIQSGLLPVVGNVVQERAGLQYATLLPALDAVVYTITTNTSADGLYVNAMLPFTVTTSVPDGGTTSEGGTSEAGATETGGSPETGGGSDGGGAETGGADGGTDAQPGG